MQLSGNIFDYVIVFGAGVITSFTPCVYPVLPITASFIAGLNTKGTKRMGFLLSVIYVFGMAISYCTLAVVAALTGKIFGQVQNHPLTLVLVGGLLIYFGLVMLDKVSMPAFNLNVSRKIKKKNMGTIILFGMASGLVISPCVAPIFGTLLFYVASKQNVAYSISLLFVFSYGLGFSLILIGTFSGILSALPRSGRWLVGIKKICGSIILIMALWLFIRAGMMIFS